MTGMRALHLRECRPGHERPNIVEDEAADGRVPLGREHHANETAHRGAYPIDMAARRAVAAEQHTAHARGLSWRGYAREQGCGVGEVKAEGIIALIRQPFALAASRNIHADNVAAIGEALRKRVEVAAVTGETVHAEDEAAAVGIAPLGVSDFVKSMRPEALKAAQAWLICHSMLFQFLMPVHFVTQHSKALFVRRNIFDAAHNDNNNPMPPQVRRGCKRILRISIS